MNTPTCPVHLTPMVESKFGGFYCKRKDENGFCKEKAPGVVSGTPRVSAVAPGAAPGPAPLGPAANQEARWAAALAFAGHIYRGAGPEMVDDALTLAKRIYDNWGPR